MSFWIQLKLLIWKNFLIRRRQKIRLSIEIVWPLLLFLILMWVRTRGLRSYIKECHFDEKALPSTGAFPFLQSFYCTFSNPCHSSVKKDPMPQLNTTLLLSFVSELEFILKQNIHEHEVQSFRQAEEDFYHVMDYMTKTLGDNSAVVADYANIGKTMIQSSEAVFSKHNMSFNFDTFEVLRSTNVSISQVIKNLIFSNAPSPRHMFCEDLFNTLVVSHYKTQLYEIRDSVCRLPFPQLSSFLMDFVTLFTVKSVTKELSKVLELQNGNTLHESAWQNVFDVFVKLSAQVSQLKNVQMMMEASVSGIGQVINMARTNTGQFLNNVICGRNITIINQTETVTNGFARLDEMGRKFHFTVTTTESTDEHDNTTSQACKELFLSFGKDPFFKILWKQVKPFVRGKILYSPNTAASHAIMSKVNESFNVINDLLALSEEWLENISPSLQNHLITSEALEFWQNLTDPKVVKKSIFLQQAWKLFFGLRRHGIETDEEDNDAFLTQLHSYFMNVTLESLLDGFRKVDEVVNSINQLLKCFDMNKIEPLDTEDEAVARGVHLISIDRLWAVIVFENLNSSNSSFSDSLLPPHVYYKIRMDADKVDSTKRVEDRIPTPGSRSNPLIDLKYITYGFVYLQDMIEHAIIQLQTGVKSLPGYWVQQFPYPCYIYDQFILAISRTFPMFMVLSWVYTSAMIIKTVVHEKEKRLKEVMKVMGLSNGVHWLGWFVNSFVIMMITVIFLTLILKNGEILQHSDPLIIFVFLTLYMMATITKSFLISTFFSKANIAAAAGGICFFVLYLPYPFLVIWEEELEGYEKAILSILSNVAFGFGCSYFAHYEEAGVGLQWHNIHVSPLLGDSYNMAKCMCMLAFDCLFYSFLTWYIEAVAPGHYGVPKPFYFPFTRSYWLGDPRKLRFYTVRQDDVEMRSQISDPNFEKEPIHLPIGVNIQRLRKVYDNGKVAVDDLSLNFYEDQITSFLGHNGAGKTTTISILTGLFPPTSGTAHIYGLDICSNMDLIRKSLGTCPQHNVLFDHLTVEEHLWFYGCLKGRMKDKVANEVNKMIHDIGLPHKRSVISRNLSGGMQRKLSVAIAFVGGSRTVILDEPTAGVDPYSRRAIWELLLKYKKNRTIILTTHHMDEADLLGDRIAIISNGGVRCCGSSLFLRRRFGNGYYLTLVRSDNNCLSASLEGDEQSTFASDVTSFVLSVIPSAKLVEDVGMELVYVLPVESKEGGAYELLFDALDQNLDRLGIASYGISDSTLEEIFLKVASGESRQDDEEMNHKSISNSHLQSTISTVLELRSGGRVTTVPIKKLPPPPSDSGHSDGEQVIMNGHLVEDDPYVPQCTPSPSKQPSSYVAVTGWAQIRRQICAIHVKRFHHARRDIKGLFCEIVLPALFVCLALIFTLILPPFRMELPLHLHPWLYGPPNFVFFSNNNPTDPAAVKYEQTLVSRPGLGTRCMLGSPIKNLPCHLSSHQQRWNYSGVPFTKVTPCSCDVGAQICPENAGGPVPPALISDTTDTLLNLTSRNISDWLVKTQKQYYKRRFGGVTFGIKNPLSDLNMSFIHNVFDRLSQAANLGRPIMTDTQYVFSEFDKGLREMPIFDHLKIWFNNRGWAAMVSYVNAINNVILRAYLPPNKNPAIYGITAVSHPLNFTSEQVQSEVLRRSGISLLHAICVIFAMSFVPASFVLYLIDDRVSKSQHLQFITGVKPITYWIANNIWDNINYLISATLCIIIFLTFSEQAYVSPSNLPGLILLLVLYGWASIPMMYPASFLFNIPSTAFVVLASANLFIGVVSTIATFILEVLDDKELQDIADILKQVFLIFPHYCLGRGLIDMATNHLAVESLQKFGVTVERYPLSWGFLGRNLLCMAIQGILFFSFTILLQYNFFIFRTDGSVPENANDDDEEDDDVSRERSLLLRGQADPCVLKIVNLTKVYRLWDGKEACCHKRTSRPGMRLQNSLLAVDRLCVRVRAGECFGLLGVNGAGKTTTFKMLTKDTSITSGDAFVKSYSIRTQMDRARCHIGYCPQFDALDSLLTGEEHLYFYARLRGIPDSHASSVVNWQLSKLNLHDYSKKCAGTYSGGNKRKLSTAIALIGNPSLVFLDEPTTGMDPQARRFLWNCISDLIREGRSVILTSHSLEECEALCTRLAIMVNGRLQCLGSIQHLKNKFGSGYSLTVRVSNNPDDLDLVKDFIFESFSMARLLEEHHNQLVFHLPSEGLTLSRLFHQMEENKIRLRIEDYSVCQTTLDQVFINFAKRQVHLKENE